MRRDRNKDNRGGRREGAGRPKDANPSIALRVLVKQSVINALGFEGVQSHLDSTAASLLSRVTAKENFNDKFFSTENFADEVHVLRVNEAGEIIYTMNGILKCKTASISQMTTSLNILTDKPLITWANNCLTQIKRLI